MYLGYEHPTRKTNSQRFGLSCQVDKGENENTFQFTLNQVVLSTRLARNFIALGNGALDLHWTNLAPSDKVVFSASNCQIIAMLKLVAMLYENAIQYSFSAQLCWLRVEQALNAALTNAAR